MNDEEKRKYEAFQYWIQTNTERGVTAIPDNLCLFVVNLIEKLQEENELAKKQVEYDKTHICTPQTIKLNYIPIQKVKDKIKKYKNMLKTCNKAKDIDRIKAISERILELQELLEGRR